MKSIFKQFNKKTAFTLVELLTVMTIVVILFSLLVPSLNMVRRYAKRVKQNAQFHSIAAGLDLFDGEFDGYPPSDPCDTAGSDYCGAMKLCEAMVGQDLLGVHENTIFRMDGTDGGTVNLYPTFSDPLTATDRENLKARKGPYVPVERVTVCAMEELYSSVAPFDPCSVVLCDEYSRVRNLKTGKKVGMPILYYKADISKTYHDPEKMGQSQNIYDSADNQALVDLPLPWDAAFNHLMASSGTAPDGSTADDEIFYGDEYGIRDEKIASIPRPKNADSYILISAGFDGVYGTEDDVFNFPD